MKERKDQCCLLWSSPPHATEEVVHRKQLQQAPDTLQQRPSQYGRGAKDSHGEGKELIPSLHIEGSPSLHVKEPLPRQKPCAESDDTVSNFSTIGMSTGSLQREIRFAAPPEYSIATDLSTHKIPEDKKSPDQPLGVQQVGSTTNAQQDDVKLQALLQAVAATILLDHAEHHPSQRGSDLGRSGSSESRSSGGESLTDGQSIASNSERDMLNERDEVWRLERARAKARAKRYRRYKAVMTTVLVTVSVSVIELTEELVEMCEETFEDLKRCKRWVHVCASVLEDAESMSFCSDTRDAAVLSQSYLGSDVEEL